ncbi:tetracycline resistance MFS efflux pump [Thalassotalea loyana]|uniref:Tetracycline resistance MFS efflux pump n=1 Tax=Thalassotalea loyana TaxID=280483 RepID=A0ABQ6HFT8_9GAMM|nr:MFS transporter [Thalassotalea loyana]GLX85592.1 tetracycline resistance MFS efflux pump [Thalassotalea loyana]
MQKQQAVKALMTMMLVVLLSCAGIALPYPILAPLFINEVSPLTTFGGIHPKLLLGMLLAIYPLGVLIGSSIIGAASDVYGRKKVLMVSLIFAMFGYLFSAFAIVIENYPLFFLTRFITGLCEGNVSIAKAVAIDLSKVLDKTRSFSLINATTYAGWLIGPLAGGFLQPFGTELAFYVAACSLGLATLCVFLFLNHEPKSKEPTSLSWYELLVKQNSLGLLKNPSIKRFFAVYLLVTLGLNAFYDFYPLWLAETFSFTPPNIGSITALLTAFMVTTSALLVTPFKRRFGLLSGIYIGLLFLAIMLFIHPLYSNSTVWLGYALIGIAIALFNGLLPIYISELHQNEQQGRLMGLLSTGFSMSNVVISILGSFVAIIGTVWAILLGAILIVCSAILLFKITKQSSAEAPS